MEYKTCNICNLEKEINLFPKNGVGGYRKQCKTCHNLKNKKWKKENGVDSKYLM